MKWTLDKQLFTGLAIIIFLFNLTLLTDFVWLWQGPETFLANDVINQAYTGLVSQITGQFSAGDPLNLIGFRLPILLITVLGLIGIVLISRKILGNDFTLLLCLTLANCYLIMAVSKVASGDAWTLVAQSIGVLSMIRFIKTPTLIWRIINYLAIAGAVWFNPIMSSVLFIVVPSAYYIFLSNGKRLWKLGPWNIVFITLALYYFSSQNNWLAADHYLGWGQSGFGWYLLVIFLSYLPLQGFFIAGITASIKNLKKREEFSLYFIPWLIVGLLIQSPSVVVVMGILITKHLQDFFVKNYPYGGYIRVYSTIHLITFFFAAAFLMLGGFFVFRGTGFRSGLSFSFVYWVLSFVLVIGVFGKNRRFIYAGAFLSGLLSTTIFCVQIFPLFENQRIHRKVLEDFEKQRVNPSWVKYKSEVPQAEDALLFYLKNDTKATIVEEN
ncbi:MAG: hypothetical protein AAF705_20195, partial [Bacteroidota bacterium]